MMFACELAGFSGRRRVTAIGITSQISICMYLNLLLRRKWADMRTRRMFRIRDLQLELN